MKVREATVTAVVVLLAFAAGYRIGADSVPALRVTVQAPPAPFVAFGPDVETLREAVVFTNGDLEQNTFTSSGAGCTGPQPKGYDPKSWKLRKPQFHGPVTRADRDCESRIARHAVPCGSDGFVTLPLYAPVERIK